MRILTVEKKKLKRVIRIPTFAPEMFFQIMFEVIFSIMGMSGVLFQKTWTNIRQSILNVMSLTYWTY